MSLQTIPEKKQESYFETGISYQNDDVYFGRKDSSALPYIIPVLSYYQKSGIYFSAFLNYLASAGESRIDAITLEGGYIFHTGNYDGQANISKFIYNSQSTSISSEIQASAGYQNGYDFGVVKTFLNLGLDFGPQIDYSSSLGIEHEFSILHGKGEFTPAICVNAGTQNFYNNYYKNKRYSNNTEEVSFFVYYTQPGDKAFPTNIKAVLKDFVSYLYLWHKQALFPVDPSELVPYQDPVGRQSSPCQVHHFMDLTWT